MCLFENTNINYCYLLVIDEQIHNKHRRTGNFLPGGGGKPFAQKNLASCPNFYERVEKK